MKITSSLTGTSARLAAACLAPLFLATTAVQAQMAQNNPKSSAPAEKKAVMVLHATGSFEVKVNPQAPDEKAGGAAIGRMLLEKQFHGDLEATSKGTMLAAGTGAKNSSGGYVALEIVTGTLKGHSGTFILQHTGTMTRGTPSLSVTVVPDSGTGQLTSLAGNMKISIADGKHSYDFEYTLTEKP
jgi:hypothetical protein